MKFELIKKYNLKFDSELVKIVTEKMNCKNWTIEQVIYHHKKWIPIPILNILINMTNHPEKFKMMILNNVSLLKCNSASSKPIKAVKELSEPLCKIAGAHAGDGNIHNTLGIEFKNNNCKDSILKILNKYKRNIKVFKTNNRTRIKVNNIHREIITGLHTFLAKRDINLWFSYGINVTEMYENNIRAFAKWIKEVFGIDVKVTHHGTKNAWRVDFDNKIIARYLIKFMGFPSGAKTYTVKEPEIIRNAPIKFRKAFLLGLMTFEGYTPHHGKAIGFSSKSKDLAENVYDIVIKLKIPIKNVKKDTYGRHVCITRILDKANLEKAQELFENNTEKWFRINDKLSNFYIKN